MKGIIKNIMLVAGALVFLASCTGIHTDSSSGEEKSRVKIAVNGSESRAANPSVATADFESFTLTGTKESGSSQTLGSWQADSGKTAYESMTAAEIEVDAGSWAFTLAARKGGSLWKGSSSAVIASGTNSLSFTLSLASIGEDSTESSGSLSIAVSFPSAVESATATLYAMKADGSAGEQVLAESGLSLEASKASYTADELAPGNYIAVFAMYKDAGVTIARSAGNATKVGSYREYVNIAAGCESKSEIAVASLENFTITYNINSESVSVNASGKGSYSHYDAVYTFPQLSDSSEAYTFEGWNTKADGSGSTLTSTDGLSGALTLYAQWSIIEWDGNLSSLTSSSTEAFATATDGMTITGTLAANVKVSIAAGATVTLDGAVINGINGDNWEYTWAGLTCAGDATIILKDGSANVVKGFVANYPGIFVPSGSTLTIQGGSAGTGSLEASSNGWASGIGGGYGESNSCGNIVITGGVITATGGENAAGIGAGWSATNGDITISGGSVTASGGKYAPGIGSGFVGTSGNITIEDTVTKVTAIKGEGATYSASSYDCIGKGASSSSCGTVTIGGTVYWNGSEYKNRGESLLKTAETFVYPMIIDLSEISAAVEVADGYTITGTLATAVKVSIADGATVTLKNASINADGSLSGLSTAGLTCEGDATIIIADGSENTIQGMRGGAYAYGGAGIFVPADKTLTIQGDTGILNVTGAWGGAGIGAQSANAAGNIVIEGGVITATGGEGAGIGGAVNSGVCGDITISGGTITAIAAGAGNSHAGIGSAMSKSCGNISITGGTVTATGLSNGSGIGSGGKSYNGDAASCGTITIADTVTKVTATKGSDTAPCSIGAGQNSTCGTITIGGTEYADGITESPYTYNPKLPTGGIDGLFSVSATKQVYFSKGNLQASLDSTQASIEWKFADHQYDFIGINPGNTNIATGTTGGVTSGTAVTVDLFGWVGENSEFTNAAAFGIVSSTTNEDYGNTSNEALKNDWGSNAITNGGNDASYGWRTLTYDEWNYVVKTRTDADSKKGAATVSDVTGWILLPDDWTLPDGASFTSGAESGYTTNSYTADEWVVMENAGAVFLPAAGDRLGTALPMSFCANQGYYWSATSSGTQSALCANFDSDSFSNSSYFSRYFGMAVRLAKDSE